MNTAQWLEKILSDKSNLNHWLQRQYVGEMNAAMRIAELQFHEGVNDENRKIIERIAAEESKHAHWIRELLEARGLELPALDTAENRYWKPVREAMETFEDIAAAGHHAERMRLVRIEALSNCQEIDADIRRVFSRILPDERFHERAFLSMTNLHSLQKMGGSHQKGLEILGLEV